MAGSAVPIVDCEQHHASVWVRDVELAAAFYMDRLGFQTSFIWGDPPTMAGIILDQVQIFLERGEPAGGGALDRAIGLTSSCVCSGTEHQSR